MAGRALRCIGLYFTSGLCMEIGGLFGEPVGRFEMRIGEVSRQAEVSIQTLRFYERKGFLPAPARSAGGYRVYWAADLKRVQFIKQSQRLGFYAEGDSRAAGYPPALCGTAYCRFRAMAEGGSYCARAASADRQQDCFVGGDAGATVWRAGRNGGAAAGVLSCGAAER